MYCKLSPEYALRKWKNTDTVLYNLSNRQLTSLELFSFITLQQCDGLTECDPNDALLRKFIDEKIAVLCEYGDELTAEQKYRAYPNEYFPYIQWAITNRCNYFCKHCFMASSFEKDTAEPTQAQCLDIITQIEQCGIRDVLLTGGEPLLRDDFFYIVDELIKRKLNIKHISTNGALVDDAFVQEIEKRGISPLFTVSFDGIGRHDWMRGVKGAEDASIRAIKLLVNHGFQVLVEMTVHMGNIDTLLSTVDMMDSLGIILFALFRASESPRWKEAGKENCLMPEQYFDKTLQLLKTHIQQEKKSALHVSGVYDYYPETKQYQILPLRGKPGGSEDTVLCKRARSVVFLSGDGRLLPCNPFNGLTPGDGDNVFYTPLQELLTHSTYLNTVNEKASVLKERSEKCRECKWFNECLGGCRALAYSSTGDYFSPDPVRCIFFEGNYADKIREIAEAETYITSG